MTVAGADTKPGTEDWGLPVTEDGTEVADEAFGSSIVGLDEDTDA